MAIKPDGFDKYLSVHSVVHRTQKKLTYTYTMLIEGILFVLAVRTSAGSFDAPNFRKYHQQRLDDDPSPQAYYDADYVVFPPHRQEITSRQSTEDYDDPEVVRKFPVENVWFENERKAAVLLAQQQRQEILDDYQDYEDQEISLDRRSFLGFPVKKRCKEEVGSEQWLILDKGYNDVVPRYYRNISCGETDDRYNEEHRRKGTLLLHCKAHDHHGCVTIEKEMHIFKKKGNCWSVDTITVQAGCKCS